MASFRSRRLRTPTAFLAYLGICSVGAVLTVPTLTGCSNEAEASEEPEPATPIPPVSESSAQNDEAAVVDPRPSLAPMIERVGPAVVSIHAFGKPAGLPSLFGTPRGRGTGSGFIIESNGIVVTNHHVVDGARRLEVHLADGRTFEAEVLGSDPATDLAVVSCTDTSGLPTVELGQSDDLRVGDWVVAIGSPGGLEHSATIGILSARGRGSLGLYKDSYIDFLQTDADIAPGSSGGPLFDLTGKVVGINTAVGADSRPGFAIPVDQAKAILPELREQGRVRRGWLGAASDPRAEADARAVIGTVYSDTPAASAGLRPGDVVLEVDGESVEDFEAFRTRIARLGPGHTVLMKVERDGQSLELSAVLAERPQTEALDELRAKTRFAPTPPPLPAAPSDDVRLGIQARAHTDGVEVIRVEAGSLADDLELEAGDVIVQLNGSTISDPSEVTSALRANPDHVEIEVLRGSARHRTVLDRR